MPHNVGCLTLRHAVAHQSDLVQTSFAAADIKFLNGWVRRGGERRGGEYVDEDCRWKRIGRYGESWEKWWEEW